MYLVQEKSIFVCPVCGASYQEKSRAEECLQKHVTCDPNNFSLMYLYDKKDVNSFAPYRVEIFDKRKERNYRYYNDEGFWLLTIILPPGEKENGKINFKDIKIYRYLYADKDFAKEEYERERSRFSDSVIVNLEPISISIK